MTDNKIEVYARLFCKMKRGKSINRQSNAKPIFIITLIELVSYFRINRINFPDESLEYLYRVNLNQYNSEIETPIHNPFYFLDSEPFYKIIWKEGKKPHPRGISAKKIKDNISYAKFDDDLWELLQDSENREYLKQVLIKEFIEP